MDETQLQNTVELYTMLADPDELRNDDWMAHFSDVAFKAPLTIGENECFFGPDGFVYFGLYPPKPGKPFQPLSIELMLDYLIEHEVGVVIHNTENQPAWVFNFGDVIAWKLYGTFVPPRFWDDPEPKGYEEEVIKDAEEIECGAPNDQMLPPAVRKALRVFMKESLHIGVPKVGVVKRPDRASHLVFNLDPALFDDEAKMRWAFEGIHWFIPKCIPVYRMDSVAAAEWLVAL